MSQLPLQVDMWNFLPESSSLIAYYLIMRVFNATAVYHSQALEMLG